MYCSQCGQRLAEGARYCMYCGAPVVSVPRDGGERDAKGVGQLAPQPTSQQVLQQAPVPAPSANPTLGTNPMPNPTPAPTTAHKSLPATAPTPQPRRKKPRSGRKTLLLAFIAAAIVSLVPIVPLVAVMLALPEIDGLLFSVLQYLIEIACAIGGIVLLGGKGMLRPRREGFAYALRIGGVALAANVALSLWGLWSYIASGETVSAQWPLNLLSTLTSMLLIGISEELLFRGLIFNGLLAPLGNTRRGMYAAVALSALIFGFAHVSAEDFASPMLVVQALVKVAQSGLWSLIPVAVLMRTGDVISAGLFHGLGNFLLSVDMIIDTPSISIEYTSTDPSEAQGLIWLYLLITVVYLPSIYAAIRSIRAQPVPCNGAFAQVPAPTVRVEPIVPCLPPAVVDDVPTADAMPTANAAPAGFANPVSLANAAPDAHDAPAADDACPDDPTAR